MEEETKTAFSQLPVTKLNELSSEMTDCFVVDGESHKEGDSLILGGPRADRYLNLASLTTRRADLRMSDFLRRHSLWKQFIEEDAAGKR